MKVTFQLTPDDYRHGLIIWRNMRAWRRWGFRLVWVGMTLLIALSMAQLAFRPTMSTLMSAAPAILVGLGWLAVMVVGPGLSARRQFRGTPSAQNPTTIEASDSGISIRSIHTESQVAWSAYAGWAEDTSVFVILPQPRIYVPIPKRAFTAEQVNEFREILQRNVGSIPRR